MRTNTNSNTCNDCNYSGVQRNKQHLLIAKFMKDQVQFVDQRLGTDLDIDFVFFDVNKQLDLV